MPKAEHTAPGSQMNAFARLADERLKLWNDYLETVKQLDALTGQRAALITACTRVLRAIEWSVTEDRMTPEEQADELRAAIAKAKGD